MIANSAHILQQPLPERHELTIVPTIGLITKAMDLTDRDFNKDAL